MRELQKGWAKSGDRVQKEIYYRLPALKSRNFRLYVVGQVFSLSGTFMTQIAVPWLIYDLTKSAWLLGLAGFLGFLPTLVLTPFSGVLSDRWNRQDLLKLVQILGICVSGTLTLLTFAGWINYWILLGLSVLAGLLKGLDMPIRHAFVVEMVENRADLGNAIALNSAMLSSSRLIGPAMGGILIASVGVEYCFLYDSLSYLAAIAALAAMKMVRKPIQPQTQSTWQKLKEGFDYVCNTLPIRSILLLLAIQGLFGISYMAVLPVFAADVLKSGADTFGFLSASGAIGSVLACVYLSLRRGIEGLERVIALCPALIGLGLIAFACSRNVWLSIVILTVVGGSGTLQVSCSNAVIQNLVEDDKRGRVMSFYALALIGMLPLSNLFAGTLTQAIGAPDALIVCGILCIVGSVNFVRHLPQLSRWIARAEHLSGDLPTTSS
ncbi:MAG: MFS transporter [Plectolyngbya sp. WJT66-NPBG17]|jgi:MFS family permease|nr:MFS transporter [Plectolyngbya sp. WJT66-NPBG17]